MSQGRKFLGWSRRRWRQATRRLLSVAGCALLAGGLVSCKGSSQARFGVEEVVADLLRLDGASAKDGVSDMVSSFDPSGGNADWADLRTCRVGPDEYLLADLKGPGCLRRIWITNVNAEEWLFRFDGETAPRVRISEKELFGTVSPGRFPFLSPLADGVSGGGYMYVPMPFAKSLRISVRIPNARADARPYFHVNYQRLPAGVSVESYPVALSVAQSNAIESVRQQWKHNDSAMSGVTERLTMSDATVEPGGEAVILDTAGQAATVNTLAIQLVRPAGVNAVQRDRMLRYLVLRANWDGAVHPSVEVPVGDFFCNGLHARRFAAQTLANVEGTLVSRFPMPFQKSGRIVIRNDGPFKIPIRYAVEVTKGTSGGRYFHAAWNSGSGQGMPFRMMRTEGRGAYVGCYLIALGMDGAWNILEGDESFYRDGEVKPVHHGTGLEDYFNAGWYYYGLFERPLHGLLEKAAMRTAQYRLQIPDPVTFTRSLQMQIEFGHGNQSRGYMSAASYWYQERPGPAGIAIPGIEQRFPPAEAVGAAASMCEIFELERAGLGQEAEERSEYFADLFGKQPIGDLYRLRSLAYREMREGPANVTNAYTAFVAMTNVVPQVSAEARLLLWRSDRPGRAIFGGTANAGYRLFVDGQPVGEGGHPQVFQGFPIELVPGDHVLQAEVVSRGDSSWYALGFLSDYTTVVSDVSWDFAVERPAGWPVSDGDASLWKPYQTTPWFFPNMQWWQFAPNAFPCVQSGQEVGGPFGGWEKPAGRTIYLRRRITVPPPGMPRNNPFVRRKEIRTPLVRPASDTSNQGVRRGD